MSHWKLTPGLLYFFAYPHTGVETMSNNPMAWEGGINPRMGDFPKAQGCLMPMGVTSENVAAAFGVSR
jgi:acetyl-CoA acyltransferase 1